MMTLLQRLDRLPPFLVLAMARRQRQALSRAEISKASGVSVRQLVRLGMRRTWAGVQVGVMVSVAEACGVNLHQQKRALAFLKETLRNPLRPLSHLSPQRLVWIERLARDAIMAKKLADSLLADAKLAGGGPQAAPAVAGKDGDEPRVSPHTGRGRDAAQPAIVVAGKKRLRPDALVIHAKHGGKKFKRQKRRQQL